MLRVSRDRNSSSASELSLCSSEDASFTISFELMKNSFYMKETFARIRNLSQTHQGCLKLQEMITEDPLLCPTSIMIAIEQDLPTLCLDIYGNYLCQKLLEHLSDRQKGHFLRIISNRFTELCSNLYGSCVIHRAFAVCRDNKELQVGILGLLEGNCLQMLTDMHGSHVVQRALEIFDRSSLDQIFRFILRNFDAVSLDRYGCCVIKKTIEKIPDPLHQQLFEKVLSNLDYLAEHQFGNYIIQHYFDIANREFAKEISQRLVGSAWYLSFQKFGSNVIERIIQHSEPEVRKLYISDLTRTDGRIGELLEDRYGNYVLQTCLDLAEVDDQKNLIFALRGHLSRINRQLIKTRISAKLDELESITKVRIVNF